MLFRSTKNSERNITYGLRNAEEYSVPRLKYNYLKNFPFYNMPVTWNEAELGKLQSNLFIFKRGLKTDLLGIQEDEVMNYINNLQIPEIGIE